MKFKTHPFLILSLAFALAFAFSLVSSCGFQIRDTTRDDLASLGIRTLYIEPVVNNTYKPGVETMVTNALMRSISSQGGFRIVSRRSEADAVLSGTVVIASSSGTARTATSKLSPADFGRADVEASGKYAARLNCFFELNREPNREFNREFNRSRGQTQDKNTRIWAATFERQKEFSASTQIGVAGTTSALINDSEFDRALQDLAEQMTLDAHNAMTSLF